MGAVAKKLSTLTMTEQVTLKIPPSMSERIIRVYAKPIHGRVRLGVLAERDVLIFDPEPMTMDVIEAIVR